MNTKTTETPKGRRPKRQARSKTLLLSFVSSVRALGLIKPNISAERSRLAALAMNRIVQGRHGCELPQRLAASTNTRRDPW
jgi:hypothetical protein